MNLLDLTLLVVIALCIFEGLRRGLVKQLLDLAGVIIAFIVASRYGALLGEKLTVLKLEKYAETLNSPFLNVETISEILYNSLGYILVFLGVLIAVRLLTVVLEAVTKLPVLGTLDKIGGLAVGAIKGCLIALAAVWILNLLPVPSVMLAVQSSGIAQKFLEVAPGLYQRVRDIISSGMLPS